MNSIFSNFLNQVLDESKAFVTELDSYLAEHRCKRMIKPAAKGYLVKYSLPDNGKSLLNFVFRKGCVKVRVYAAHVSEYENIIEAFPEKTKKEIATALDCKKLTGKTCSPTCPAGYAFVMDGVEYKKCRSMAFLPALNVENNPVIRKMIEEELRFVSLNI